MSWPVFVASDVGRHEGGPGQAPGDEVASAGESPATAFAAALALAGVRATVEVRARLAVVHLADDTRGALGDVTLRRRVMALGRAAGFTHVAVAVGET